MIRSRKMLKRVGYRRQPCLTPTVVLNPHMMPFIWTGLVALSWSCSEVRTRFASMKSWYRFVLMLDVLFTQDSKVKDLFYGVSSGSGPSLFFSNYLFCLGFQPIQDDFQPDLARMSDEADSSIVLTELSVVLCRQCKNQLLSPWVRLFSCCADPVTDLCFKKH